MLAIRRIFALALAGLALVATLATAAESTLTKVVDLAADAASARKIDVPLLILYSLAGCPHCEAIRRGHLTPLAAEIPLKAIIRQIDLQSAVPMRGFDGKAISHDDFARAQGIKFAPVVVFYNADGKRLGEALVGSMLPDYYGVYLADGLTAAAQAMRQQQTKLP